jgi:hypothetical protein
LVLVLAVLAALVLGETAVLAVAVKKSGGAITAVRTATDSAVADTISATPVDVPGMKVNVSVPDGQHALLIATFSATTACNDFAAPYQMWCHVRVVVDGTPAAPPNPVFAAVPDGGSWDANSMQFVAGPVGSGDHVVKVQFWVEPSGGGITLRERTLTVLRSRV